MIARGFKSVAWVATIGSAALVCYIFSLKVAEERAGLDELETQIQRTERSIRTLKTELGTRGRVHQLQHWAAADFGFASPTASQFVEDEVRLASLDAPVEAPMEAPVQLAAAQSPSPAAELPRAIQASAPARRVERQAVRQASAEPAEGDRPLLRRAAVVTAAAAPEPRRAAASRAERPAQVAGSRSASLVDQRTLRDLDTRARAERAGDRTTARPR